MEDQEGWENDRAERAAELVAEYGPDWPEQWAPGTLGSHELLDRTFIVADNLENFVLSHPACVANAEWYALASQAVDLLQMLYQEVGGAWGDMMEGTEEERGT